MLRKCDHCLPSSSVAQSWIFPIPMTLLRNTRFLYKPQEHEDIFDKKYFLDLLWTQKITRRNKNKKKLKILKGTCLLSAALALFIVTLTTPTETYLWVNYAQIFTVMHEYLVIGQLNFKFIINRNYCLYDWWLDVHYYKYLIQIIFIPTYIHIKTC